MKKKGVSPVIATVLIVMITVMAVGILASFVIPMIEDMLEGSTSCFEVMDHIEIVDDIQYTCYNSSAGAEETRVRVRRAMEDVDVDGIYVELDFETYEIIEDPHPKVDMLDRDGDEANAKLPKAGARTYIFDEVSERVEVGIILPGGSICEIEGKNLNECRDPIS